MIELVVCVSDCGPLGRLEFFLVILWSPLYVPRPASHTVTSTEGTVNIWIYLHPLRRIRVARQEVGGFSIICLMDIQSLPEKHALTFPLSPPPTVPSVLSGIQDQACRQGTERPRIPCPGQLGTATNPKPGSPREPPAGSLEKGN